jgi:SNF2 family DNA or RNA helicase
MSEPVPVHAEDYAWKTEPYKHQREIFLASRDCVSYGLLMGMGTGKSKIVIDTAAYNFYHGRINCLVVVAPKGVHRNWIMKEVPIHMPDWTNYRGAVWSSDMRVKEKRAVEHVLEPGFEGLRVIAVNLEGFTNSVACRPAKFLRPILNSLNVMMIVDESSKIKTPGAKRTKAMYHLGTHSVCRRILTGTPVTNSPFDIYSQFRFLDPSILGFDNFVSFKKYFAEWETEFRYIPGRDEKQEYEALVAYKNLDLLKELIKPHSSRITKEECLDLPDKIYQIRYVELSEDQRKVYNRLIQDSVIEMEGQNVPVANILTRLLRLQQIIGGFVPEEEFGVAQPIGKSNPRIQSVLDILEEAEGKVIIWARFRPELAAIEAALKKEYGPTSTVCYHGGVEDADRSEAEILFQGERPILDEETHQVIRIDPVPEVEQAQYFVGNQQSGGFGLTLTAATTVIYFSNSFSLEDRLQSEDRAHRIGQHHPVNYVDLECRGTIDTKIITALQKKMNLADMVTEDSQRIHETKRDEVIAEVVQQLFALVPATL